MTDRDIIELAKSIGIITGENLRRGNDYLFRSMGTATNVWGRDLTAFARAARAWTPPRPMPCDDCSHPTLCADFPEQHRTCGVGLLDGAKNG